MLRLGLRGPANNIDKVRINKQISKVSKANHEGLKRAVESCDWDIIFQNQNLDTACADFISALRNNFERHIPYVDKTIKQNDMPWMNHDVRNAMNRRKRLYKKMVKVPSVGNVRSFKEAVQHVRQKLADARSSYHDKVCRSLNEQYSGSKNYWHILKQLLGKKANNGIPALTTPNGVADSDDLKCRAFYKN